MIMSTGALVAYGNLIETADTITADGVIAGYPVTNLQKRQLSSKCRMDADTDTHRINIGWNIGTRALSVIGLIGVQNERGSGGDGLGGMKVEYTTNGSTWFTAGIVDGVFDTDMSLPFNSFLILSTPIAAHALRITPLWDADDYREMSRIWLSDSILIPNGCDGNWSVGFVDPGKLDTSAGGQAYESKKLKRRILKTTFSVIDTLLAFGMHEDSTFGVNPTSFQALQMECGTTGEVLVMPRLSTQMWQHRIGVYGHLTGPFDITHQGAGNYQIPLEVEEER